MVAARGDAAMSTAGLVSPVPGTGRAMKMAKMADKAADTRKAAKAAEVLAENRKIGAEGEKLVTGKLKKEAGENEVVLERVTGKFKDGSRTVFDNLVVDKKTGKVVMANETKTGGAKLSSQQKRFYENGESVELVGKKSDLAKGQSFNSGSVKTQVTRIPSDE